MNGEEKKRSLSTPYIRSSIFFLFGSIIKYENCKIKKLQLN